MSAFQAFDETLSQLLPEMENFANQIEQQPVIERPIACYPPQYEYQNYFGYYQRDYQSQHQYRNQYSSYQPYSYLSYPPPAPITIIIPKCDDQRVIKLEINMGVAGQASQINVTQNIVEEIREPVESFSYQAITELLEPSDYSTVYDSAQNTVYTEMNNVNSQELLDIDEKSIFQNLEIPKSVKVAANKSKTPKVR